MADELEKAKEDLIQAIGRLSSFAGFNKAMGQIYGLLYLSKEPMSLGEIAEELGISKGNASLNMRNMERWGLIRSMSKRGDRRDYYQAEIDFWKIARGILNERDKKEMDYTIDTITNILDSVSAAGNAGQSPENRFYQERLGHMLAFGNATRHMVQAFLTFDSLHMSSLLQATPEKDQSHHIEIEE
jgi:DNA-binding transcriptional regulator GbsR (MarR family)